MIQYLVQSMTILDSLVAIFYFLFIYLFFFFFFFFFFRSLTILANL